MHIIRLLCVQYICINVIVLFFFSVHYRGLSSDWIPYVRMTRPDCTFLLAQLDGCTRVCIDFSHNEWVVGLYINMVIVSQNSPLINKALQPVQRMVVKFHKLVRVLKIFRTDNDFRVVVLIQDQWATVLPDHCALKFGFTWYRVLYHS